MLRRVAPACYDAEEIASGEPIRIDLASADDSALIDVRFARARTQVSVHAATAANIETTREQLRHDARGLGVLELIQTVIGIGVLVFIAVRAILASQDGGVQTAISCALILALAYLAMAFRMRSGAEIARRELWLMEAGQQSAPSSTVPHASAHPYRPMPREVALPTRSRGLRIESHAAIPALATGVTLACVAISGA